MNASLTVSWATDCKQQPLLFQDLGSRNVVADFSGGALSSDGGGLLLRQADLNLGLTQSLARCFCDTRQQVYVDHSVRQLLAQRLYGLALGYEELNDHRRLRLDPPPAAACGKMDPLGQERLNQAHRGIALAGASTLNVRPFAQFEYQTVRSGSRSRRVLGKAEVTAQGSKPRFIVTHRPRRASQGTKTKADAFRPASTRTSIAGAGRWKTCSSSKRWICGPTG